MLELFNLLPEAWKLSLAHQEVNLSRISTLISGRETVPHHLNIFRALEIPPASVKVVIVGQDPYPNSDDAMGLAFSVPEGKKNLPPTLRNIFKELKSDLGIENSSGDLTSWSNQGVLLLNRVLTTDAGVSMAHKGLGWEEFTNNVLQAISQSCSAAVLWGNAAKEVSSIFPKSTRIESPHPSPLSAHRGFFGSAPFSRVNQILKSTSQTEIDWRTD